MSELANLKDDPRIYIKNRAARLVRLVELNAPNIIVEGEIQLLNNAIEALRDKEGRENINPLNREDDAGVAQ